MHASDAMIIMIYCDIKFCTYHYTQNLYCDVYKYYMKGHLSLPKIIYLCTYMFGILKKVPTLDEDSEASDCMS